jgi:predicted transcriptional regulator
MKTLQFKLDADTGRILAKLVDHLGLSPSMVIRDSIRALAACQPKTRKIAGLGKFSSGISNLASNKKHLQGFGR